MREINTFLTATDFSRGAKVAAKAAKVAADLYDAKVVAAHILQNMDESISLLVEDVDHLEKQALEDAEENMGALLEDVRFSMSRTRSVVTQGSPVDGLIRVALREHADVVTAGMAGTTGESDPGTLGSVVERLVMCGLFDLLLVHDSVPMHFKQVAIATDFSPSADIALRRTIDIAKRIGDATVTIIHAYEWPSGYSKLGLSSDETDAKVRTAVQERYEEMVKRFPAPEGITYEPIFVRGRPQEAVRDACLEHDIDLLVIGAVGRTAAAVALIGNVAIKIARRAPCSVWVARPAGEKLTIMDALQRLMGLSE